MAELPLSEKREKWVNNRSEAVIKGTRLNYNASLQDRYVKQLTALVKQVAAQVKREVVKFLKTGTATEFFDDQEEAAAMDASIASQAKVLTDKLMKKFSDLFDKKSKSLAEGMVDEANKTSEVNLRQSLKTLSGGLILNTSSLTQGTKEIMKASVSENVSLIKSIGEQYLGNVQKAVLRSITTGNGLQDLIPALSRFEGISYRHARNVALDQTRKVYNSVNKGRMQASGVKKFEWVHSGGGQKPRKDHIEMDGNIYSFDDLPVIDRKTGERGIPGQAINCRCTMVPVLEFDDGEQA